ncbi:MAG: hypothetical protein JW928_05265 [Candidatus Aureabacteria bacterium]|nr:hypothetical protein [Candidatus Auribacterota bacterium]
MISINGLTAKKNDMDIQSLLKKRRKILQSALNSQDAFWVMMESGNLDQITDMLQTINRSLENLSAIDKEIKNISKSTDTEADEDFKKEIRRQADILKNISDREKNISKALREKRRAIASSLEKIRKEKNFTHAYSQNLKRKKPHRFNKEI